MLKARTRPLTGASLTDTRGSPCRAGLRHPQRASGPPLLAGPVTTEGPLSVDPEPGHGGLGMLCGPRPPPRAPSGGDAPPWCPVSISVAPVGLRLCPSVPACLSVPALEIYIDGLTLCVSLPPVFFANILSLRFISSVQCNLGSLCIPALVYSTLGV